MRRLRSLPRLGVAALTVAATLASAAHAQPSRAASAVTAGATVTVWTGGLNPDTWTKPSAAHPTVHSALRLIAQQFEKDNPGVTIVLPTNQAIPATGPDNATWLTAHVAGGTAPEIVRTNFQQAVKQNWCLPLDSYLQQPNPFIPGNKRWIDAFYPGIQKAIPWTDGHSYNLPLSAPYPKLILILDENLGLLKQAGYSGKITTYKDQWAAAAKLKSMGYGGMSPWPSLEAAYHYETDTWPLQWQLLEPFVQAVAPAIDANHDNVLSQAEMAKAVAAGKWGPSVPQFKAMLTEYKKDAQTWTPGWRNTDLTALWDANKIGLQEDGYWTLISRSGDPKVTFKHTFAILPEIQHSDDSLASAPVAVTAGDGKIPANLVSFPENAVSDVCVIKSSVQAHHNLAQTIRFLQYMLTPKNNAFIVNEDGGGISVFQGTPILPAFAQFNYQRLPVYKYDPQGNTGIGFDNQGITETDREIGAWIAGRLADGQFWSQLAASQKASAQRFLSTAK